MMWRPKSFVFHIICINLILFNWLACAELTTYSLPITVNDIKNVRLLTINNSTKNVRISNDNGAAFKDVAKFDVAQTQTINNESSQRIDENFGLIPNHPNQRNYLENRYENSKSIAVTRRHKRTTQDICETSECKCKLDTKFLTVDCYFQQVSKFSIEIRFFFIYIMIYGYI